MEQAEEGRWDQGGSVEGLTRAGRGSVLKVEPAGQAV